MQNPSNISDTKVLTKFYKYDYFLKMVDPTLSQLMILGTKRRL